MPSRIIADRTTARLVRGAKIGDREAFDELFGRVGGRAQMYARLRLEELGLGRIGAAEVVREIYLTAYRAFSRFGYSDEESFLVWICRILENRIAVVDRMQPPGPDETAHLERRPSFRWRRAARPSTSLRRLHP